MGKWNFIVICYCFHLVMLQLQGEKKLFWGIREETDDAFNGKEINNVQNLVF